MQLFYKKIDNDEHIAWYDETPKRKLARKIEYSALFLVGTVLLIVAMIFPSKSMENIVGIVLTAISLLSAAGFLYTLFLHILLKENITKGEYEFAVKRFRISCGIYGGLIVLTLLVTSVLPIFLSGYSIADFLTMGCQFTAVLCIGSIFFIEVNRPLECEEE